MAEEAAYYLLPFVLARWPDGRSSPPQKRFVSCSHEEAGADDKVVGSLEVKEEGFAGFHDTERSLPTGLLACTQRFPLAQG
jgi:hypothetical protein